MCYNAIHYNTLQHNATHYMLHCYLRAEGRLLIPESNTHVIYHMRACYQEWAIWNTNTGRKKLESDSKKPKSHSILCKNCKTVVEFRVGLATNSFHIKNGQLQGPPRAMHASNALRYLLPRPTRVQPEPSISGPPSTNTYQSEHGPSSVIEIWRLERRRMPVRVDPEDQAQDQRIWTHM